MICCIVCIWSAKKKFNKQSVFSTAVELESWSPVKRCWLCHWAGYHSGEHPSLCVRVSESLKGHISRLNWVTRSQKPRHSCLSWNLWNISQFKRSDMNDKSSTTEAEGEYVQKTKRLKHDYLYIWLKVVKYRNWQTQDLGLKMKAFASGLTPLCRSKNIIKQTSSVFLYKKKKSQKAGQ